MTLSQAPVANPARIFLIAAEESGDRLGASLIGQLRSQLNADVEFFGIGGEGMAAAGVASLFPIEELSILGLAAIPRRLPLILRRIREATDAVVTARPDVLVIIDSPDFTHRVARRVRAHAPSIPIVNYVSPTVWAWRSGRARAMRHYIDHVMAVLPFEPAVHQRLGGPPCSYVGHPLLEQIGTLRPDENERARRAGKPPVLLVLPGSRRSEINRHMPVFGETLKLLHSAGVDFEAVLPTLPHLVETVRAMSRQWAMQPRIELGEDARHAAFRIARGALTKSGTVTLELALAGVPMVTAYKVAAWEAWIARRVAYTSTIILANLVLGANVVPEFVQEMCRPDVLAAALKDVLVDAPPRQRQVEACATLDSIMSTGGRWPSQRAADIVIETMRKPAR